MAVLKPRVVVLSGPALFSSFFDAHRERRLSRSFRWTRSATKAGTPRLRALLADAEALVTTWDSPRFGEELTALAPRLRLIAHCGGEVKGKFGRPLFERLAVTNAPGPMAPYVAELAVTFLLMAARRVDEHREALRERSNRAYEDAHLHGCGQETLIGRTVGLVGFGRIGREIAQRLRPFGVRLLVHDPYAPSAAVVRLGARPVTLQAMLPQAEFLVLAAGLTDETRGMIGARQLTRLPEGATVVNVARGGLLDLVALTREVRRGRLRCALDVTDPLEPLPLGHPLRRLPGAVLTPHVGAGAIAVRRAMADIVLDTLERFFRGKRVTNRVTPAMLDLMT
ncbi:MAG TPA: hydroxyacid dehydrogenase [Vicinamibacteria bacterium]